MAAISSSVSMLSKTTISMLEKCKSMNEVHQIHAHMLKTNLVTHTSTLIKLIEFCSFSTLPGAMDYAYSVFIRTQNPNPFIFSAIAKGICDSPNPFQCIVLYAHMVSFLNNLQGIEFSLPYVLKSCGKSLAYREAIQVFAQILKTRFWFDQVVSNSVVRMFMELGETGFGRQAFDKMPERDVISWNSIITGYLRVGKIESARGLFDDMPQRDLVSCNAMIDGYGKAGRCDLAEQVFSTAIKKDVVTWTSMISSYVMNHKSTRALDLFREMLKLGVRPDVPAIVTVLSAISDLGFVEEGIWVHNYISAEKIKLTSGFIASALIDMYCKCGYIDRAYHIFRSVSSFRRRIGDWNSMISGFAMHGLGQEAIEVFLEMEKHEDIDPDEITFLGLLSACNHGGLVNEGETYFKRMVNRYRITPKIQHYGCMIDLYGRVGRLEDALEVTQRMPMDPDILVWKSILSASFQHGCSTQIGEYAAFRALELNPKDSSSYVLLSNIYAKAGRWDDVAKVRSKMVKNGVRKIPGCSSIHLNGKVHHFVVAKQMDERCYGEVLCKVEELVSRLKLEGYKVDTSQVLLDVDEDDKKGLLKFHSEKMALAYGLLNADENARIRIVKNLRISCDCHSFMESVSRVYERKIIVRDQNRFHSFENGFCSCKGYW